MTTPSSPVFHGDATWKIVVTGGVWQIDSGLRQGEAASPARFGGQIRVREYSPMGPGLLACLRFHAEIQFVQAVHHEGSRVTGPCRLGGRHVHDVHSSDTGSTVHAVAMYRRQVTIPGCVRLRDAAPKIAQMGAVSRGAVQNSCC